MTPFADEPRTFTGSIEIPTVFVKLSSIHTIQNILPTRGIAVQTPELTKEGSEAAIESNHQSVVSRSHHGLIDSVTILTCERKGLLNEYRFIALKRCTHQFCM